MITENSKFFENFRKSHENVELFFISRNSADSKLPPQCIDQMETCSDVIPLCDNPDINFICPFSCKADHCSEYFTTAPPTTAAYVPAVTMRPTTISTTVDPRTDCEDMHKTCPQLANHCGIPGYRIAAICMKTCKMCHMKARDHLCQNCGIGIRNEKYNSKKRKILAI